MTDLWVPDNSVPHVDPAMRAAIEALVIEYAWVIDHRELDRLVDLCTEDAVLIGLSPSTVEGRTAIRDFASRRMNENEGVTRHVVTSVRLVPISSDVAEGWVSQLFFVGQREVDGVVPSYVGEYHDTYLQNGSVWRFQRRELTRTPINPATATRSTAIRS